MKLQLVPGRSRAAIALASGGPLKALAHDREVVAPLPALALDVDGDGPWTLPVELDFAAADLRPDPDDLSAKHRRDFLDNMLGAKVLDAERHPRVRFVGQYAGDFGGGELRGELFVRGRPQAIAMAIDVADAGYGWLAQGAWHGRLSDLGIRPFKILLGAIRLEDRVTIRVAAAFERA